MNLLLETGLPQEIGGIPISPDFRNMIRFELILQDERLSESEKLYHGLRQLWPAIPQDVEWACGQLLWFYGGGQKEKGGNDAPPPRAPRAYDFDQDAQRIYAGFYAAYGIRLTTVRFLHWWEFLALLAGLPESTQMGQILYYRTVDLAKIRDKHQREFLAAQQKRWALDSLTAGPRRTAQELEQATRERVRKRSEEVRRLMEAGQGRKG